MTADPNIRGPHNTPCQHCGALHGVLCPFVSAMEYAPDGSLKRVEFHSPGRDLGPAGFGSTKPGAMTPVGGEARKVRELSWLHGRWVWASVVRDGNGLILTVEYVSEAN